MSNVIPKAQLEGVQNWDLPLVGEGRRDQAPAPPTAEEIEKIQKQAYDEAFAQGYREGLEQAQGQAQSQLRAQAKRLDALMSALAQPFEALDERVEDELVHLVMALARQLVRREIRSDPGQIVAVVREAMRVLPVSTREVVLHLHTEDAALVREALALAEGEHAWRIVEDPALTRGGCRVSADASHIDARVESRLAAIFTSVFGGERAADAADSGAGHGAG